MIFIVTGEGENGPVSLTCDSARAALVRAQGLAGQGVRDLLIDADGQEYAPADFKRLFIEQGPADAAGPRPGLDSEQQQEEPDPAA